MWEAVVEEGAGGADRAVRGAREVEGADLGHDVDDLLFEVGHFLIADVKAGFAGLPLF